MRVILGISLLVIGTIVFSCQIDGANTAQANVPPTPTWIRTADGWEKAGSWCLSVVQPPTLHPLVAAAGQGLVSIFALVAFRTESE
jgi:hypothetical protein